MAKLSLTDVAAGYGLVATYNANNDLIEAALENTLSRDGTTPNTMSVDLDMNSNQLNNLAVPVNDQEAATKKYVDDIVTGFTDDSGAFSAALPYTITGAWDFDQSTDFSQGLRILDAGKTDQVLFGHNGTNMTVTATNTGDFNWSGITGNYTFNKGLEVYTNGSFKSLNAGDVESIYMWHDGAAGVIDTVGDTLSLKSISGTGVMRLYGTGYHFLESAAAASNEAGFGQLWIKDDAPNSLYFTDDAGTDVAIVTGGALVETDSAEQYKYTASDQSVSSGDTGTTLVDVTGLTGFTIAANTYYKFKATIPYTQEVGNIKLSVEMSQISQNNGHMHWSAVDFDDVTAAGFSAAYGTDAQITTLTDASNMVAVIEGTFLSHASVAATLKIQFAQESSSANVTTIMAPAWMEVVALS